MSKAAGAKHCLCPKSVARERDNTNKGHKLVESPDNNKQAQSSDSPDSTDLFMKECSDSSENTKPVCFFVKLNCAFYSFFLFCLILQDSSVPVRLSFGNCFLFFPSLAQRIRCSYD